MPSLSEPRVLLRTLTGEDFQPARVYYAILDGRRLDAAFQQLRCVQPDPTHHRWVWLWAGEARPITFEVPYERLHGHVHPIVLGHLRVRDGATLLLDVRSFGRLVEGLRFFGTHLGPGVVRATHVRLVNRLFTAGEGPAAGQSLDAYLEQGEVAHTDAGDFIARLTAATAGARVSAAEMAVALDATLETARVPTPVLEDLPLHEDDMGDFVSLQTALRLRNLEALEHWQGNTGVSSLDLIERMLGPDLQWLTRAAGGQDATSAPAADFARGGSKMDPTSDHEELIAQVLRAGARLPERVRRQVLEAGASIVPALIALAVDAAAAMTSAPGEGNGPIHAVELLCDLRAEEAIEPLFRLLLSTDSLTLLHDLLIRKLPDLGSALVEPGLRHLEGPDADHRSSVLAVLANVGVWDDRVFAALLDELRVRTQPAAMHLANYGDPRALPHLERSLADVRLGDDHELFGAGHDVIELIAAIETLGGEVSAVGRARQAQVKAMRDAVFAPLEHALAEPRAEAVRVGRNDPCPCGSGRKYKKCCLGKA